MARQAAMLEGSEFRTSNCSRCSTIRSAALPSHFRVIPILSTALSSVVPAPEAVCSGQSQSVRSSKS